jgi:hypothetical protein
VKREGRMEGRDREIRLTFAASSSKYLVLSNALNSSTVLKFLKLPTAVTLAACLAPPSSSPLPKVTLDTPTLCASANSKECPPTLNEVGRTTSAPVSRSVIPLPAVYDPVRGRASSESLSTSILRSVSLCQKAGETSVEKGANWRGGIVQVGCVRYLECIWSVRSGRLEPQGGGGDVARSYR